MVITTNSIPEITFALHLGQGRLEQRAAELLDLVHEKGQHHQQGEHHREVLFDVTEVVFQAVSLIFQGVERFVFDLPPGPATTHDGVNRLGCQPQVGDPREILQLAIGMDFPIFEYINQLVRVRLIQGKTYVPSKVVQNACLGVDLGESRCSVRVIGFTNVSEQEGVIARFDTKNEVGLGRA